jgi:CRP/FNR family transcriptional regulator, cyclic AMP receptor protein
VTGGMSDGDSRDFARGDARPGDSRVAAPAGGADAPPTASSADFPLGTLLGVLSPADRVLLAQQSTLRSFEKGQVVFLEGERSDSLLVLTRGRLKVSTFSSNGDELILSMVSPGETVGELGIFSDVPRSATVVAVEPSAGRTLSQKVVLDLVSRRPDLATALLRQMAEMVRRLTGVAADLVFLDLNQRVAKFLLSAVEGNDTAEVRVTQSQLAYAIGASRQRVNQCLRTFDQHRWVVLGPRRILIRDAAALRRIVNPAPYNEANGVA